MEESLAETLYDLVRTEQFAPFSILFASGQRPPASSRLGDGHLMKFFAFDCNAAQARATFAWQGRP